MRGINPGVKTILSTGYSDDEMLSNYREYGFVDYLKKPFTVEELKKKVFPLLVG